MAITLNPERSDVNIATLEISYADLLGTSGVAQDAFKMPAGSIVVGGYVTTTVALNSATSDVISVGDATLATRYISGTNVHAVANAALVPTGFKTTKSEGAVKVTWTGVGAAPSAGSVRVVLQYITVGEGEFLQY